MGKISEFYNGKNILVTGATGFCGKVLVEKLLRSCEEIGKIYILVRKKKDASPLERYIEYINHFIFDSIRKSTPDVLKKICLISGDINFDGLQLSQHDVETLVNDIQVIFHCAANVKFNDTLKDAVNNNTTGTLRVLQFAEQIKNFEVFSYMSTAFCQSYQEELEEKYYPSNLDVFDIIEQTQTLDDATLQELEVELLAKTKHPNTYTLSKALAEDVVYSFQKKFPIVIVRPSLVWYTINEPFEGFIEGMHSGLGLIAGGMTGFIRTMWVGDKSAVKVTPADYVANATIASVWKRSESVEEDVQIYNCTDAEENRFFWNQSFKMVKEHFTTYAPYEKLLWYPNISFTSSYVMHMISFVLFQLIPAMVFDTFRILSGKKAIFTTLQRKIISGIRVLYYFTTRNFQFETTKLRELYSELDQEDKTKFSFDHSTIVWKNYHENGLKSIRRLLLKEDDATIPKGQAKVKKLYYADIAVKAACSTAVLYYLLRSTCWIASRL